MKRIKQIIIVIIGLSMLLFTLNMAAAVGNGNGAGTGSSSGNVVSNNNQLINQGANTQIREEIRTRLQEETGTEEKAMSTVKGLENAMVRVSNPNAVARITQNLERWQNKYQYRYEKQTALEGSDGKTLIQAERSVRVLFFKFRVKDNYEINDQGEVISQYRNWLSNLIPPEEVIEN